MTGEWRDASENGRQPRWSYFTEACIRQACEQVASANPDWHPDLYATDLSKYIAGSAPKTMWWVLPGSKSSAVQGSADGACLYFLDCWTILTMCAVTMGEPDDTTIPPIPPATSVPPAPAVSASLVPAAAAPPPPPAPPGLLTRAAKAKGKARAEEPPDTASAGPSSARYSLRKKPQTATIIPSSDDSDGAASDSSDSDTPKKVAEMPPGVAVPRVQVEVASPPRVEEKDLPFATGEVLFTLYAINS